MPEDLLTYKDAAAVAGYADASAISRLVGRGHIGVYERYGRKLVSRSEVLAYNPTRGKRPRKAGN